MIRQVDIFPSILNLISLPSPNNIDGENIFSLKYDDNNKTLFSHIESPPAVKNQSIKYIGLRNSEFKFIQDIDGNSQSYELYDLTNDPNEEKNLVSAKPEQIEIFKKELFEIRKNKISQSDSKFDYNEKQKIDDVLKKLGYT